ncbi:type III polyketide synthase [Acanthopleuribacter pedis]|uniref:Type III polyketide synthase n=1 Tax=Acanthopleuribacter pedis TaxID=442870 RepID=A0A8J7U1I2_9BACT|nr:type III polyketide synthase [Acanthopleuribacter pedis]MBO1317552.1 type III polyketide synthase [Acanthopleuribacter pedis]
MSTIKVAATALPDVKLDQDQVLAMGRRLLKGKVPFVDQALRVIGNAGVDTRYLVKTPDEILDNPSLTWRNGVYHEAAIDLGTRVMDELLQRSGKRADQIDMIITTSCTGFMIPSVDAYLVNRFRMRSDVKRLPITELGCAAGAMALSRAREYLCAYPDHTVAVIAIELPSLTYRTKDFRMANLVSAALFGDGAAGLLLTNEPGGCRVNQSRTHFFHGTPELMGFDLGVEGFKIILDKSIPKVVKRDFVAPAKAFLAAQPRRYPEQPMQYVLHPGGRKILDTLRDEFGLQESDVAASRQVLARVGNLSSASVYWVLAEKLAQAVRGDGFMAAFGPGFNAEMLSLAFE